MPEQNRCRYRSAQGEKHNKNNIDLKNKINAYDEINDARRKTYTPHAPPPPPQKKKKKKQQKKTTTNKQTKTTTTKSKDYKLKTHNSLKKNAYLIKTL